jgi:starch synthase
MKILMIAAENGALPGGKVGGIGDVIRDLPAALAAVGHRVTVLTPSYGRFAALPGTEQLAVLEAAFGGRRETLRLHRLAPIGDSPVDNLVLDHPRFAAGGKGSIYHDDGDERPFATDASSFALFCS